MKRYLLYASNRYALPVLRPLQSVIRSRGDAAFWFATGSAASRLLPDEQRIKTASAVMDIAPAAVFVAGNVVPDFFPGIKVQVFHGFNARKRPDDRGHFRIRGFFDLYCTQGPDTTVPFRELAERLGHFRVTETGWTKMDPLFQGSPAPPKKKKRPLILYTSTFTPELSAAYHLEKTLAELSASGEYDWAVTFHPKMAPAIVNAYRSLENDYLTFIETDDVIPLLREADVMISDTSSIAYEFLLQHRPVITFRTRMPAAHFINVTEPESLSAAICRALDPEPKLIRAIRDCSDQIHPYRDGKSSERVLDAATAFIETGMTSLKPKPRNLLRRLKIRRTLRYFRW